MAFKNKRRRLGSLRGVGKMSASTLRAPAFVYLIHFGRPFVRGKRSCQHYLGSTIVGVENRMFLHRAGRGSKLMRLVSEEGIPWSVVKTWETTREERYRLERRLKNQRNHKRLCPVCKRGKE